MGIQVRIKEKKENEYIIEYIDKNQSISMPIEEFHRYHDKIEDNLYESNGLLEKQLKELDKDLTEIATVVFFENSPMDEKSKILLLGTKISELSNKYNLSTKELIYLVDKQRQKIITTMTEKG